MLKLTLLLFVLLVTIFLVWRFASERQSLPCPAWLSWFVEMDNPLSKINRAASILKHAGIKKGMHVLDAGSGPGRTAIPAAHTVGVSGKVVALDIQQDMLKKVQEKADVAGVQNITYLHAGLGEGKLEHNVFDRVLLVTVLGEIPDQKAALREIFGALKPGGVLCITEIIFDPHYQRIAHVQQLAQQIGFVQKEIESDRFAYAINLEKPLS